MLEGISVRVILGLMLETSRFEEDSKSLIWLVLCIPLGLECLRLRGSLTWARGALEDALADLRVGS